MFLRLEDCGIQASFYLTLIVGIPVIFTVITVIMYKAHKKVKGNGLRGVYDNVF